MFGVKQAFQRYVALVAPWGQREWDAEDFTDPAVVKYRTEPSHMLFLIPTRPMPGFFEQWLLGKEASDVLVTLLGIVSRFNDAATRFNYAAPEARLGNCIAAHGVVGVQGSGGLYDWVRKAQAL